MELLNKDEAKFIKGGDREKIKKICAPIVGDVTIWLCANVECNCPGTFTYKCGTGDIQCSSNFSTTNF